MSNLHRIAWIDAKIRAGAYPNCTAIARRFEISRRQAMRDVEYLRDSMGAPLEYSGERKGYFYGEGSYVLPSLLISDGEKRTLSYLASEYSRCGSALGERIASLFQRIAAGQGGATSDGGPDGLPVIPLEPGERGVYSALMDAITGRYAVGFGYTNAQGVSTRRVASPYKLFRKSSVNYMVGFCSLKRGIRVFRLGRISDIERAEEPFIADPGFREGEYGERAFFDYSAPYRARISLDARSNPAALEHTFSRLPDGRLEVEFRNPSRLIMALLGLEAGFEILEPAWLRDRLERKIASIAKKNFGWDIICHTPPPIVASPKTKEGVMAKKIIQGAAMGRTWTSYVGAAYGCLKAAGLWKDEIWKMQGLSGIGFHFIVHKDLCPSSVTVYDWNAEHVECMDRLGVFSEAFGLLDHARHATFEAAREKAVQRIKQSIDRGMPAVVWAPTFILEFGVVSGYDDGDRVFFVEQCTGQPADPLLYDNLGKTSEVPMLAYQIFYNNTVTVDESRDIHRSLAFGLSEWKKENHVDPQNYASGMKGYASFIGALERGTFNEFGLGYLASVYADSKGALTRYLGWAAEKPAAGKSLGKAADLMGKTAAEWAEISKLVPFSGGNGRRDTPIDKKAIASVLKHAKDAFALEKKAMEEIGAAI